MTFKGALVAALGLWLAWLLLSPIPTHAALVRAPDVGKHAYRIATTTAPVRFIAPRFDLWN